MNDLTPLVSIIIPVYNVEPYLRKALESIINQTYSNLQIIIINDGSTDGSQKIIDKFACENSNRITVVTQKNQGLSGARNTGLKYVNGKYIYFFDSDDILKSDAIEKLVEFCEINSLDVCRFEAISFIDNNLKKNIDKNKYALKSSQKNSIVSSELYVSKPYKVRMPVWLYFYSSKIVLENELMFESGTLHEDELFTPQVLCSINQIGLIPEIFFYRRIRENSIMNNRSNKMDKGKSLRKISNKLFLLLEKNKTKKQMNKFIEFRVFRCFCMSVYLLGDLKKIRREELNDLGIKYSLLICWIWTVKLRDRFRSVFNDK